ncbi:MAG TPA: hypothetical protein VNL98_12935 [Gemmatimonadales bacterium]|nr:hypothetical protein [Gemmatimonadales bacterium]
MLELLAAAIAVGAGVAGYVTSRDFTRRRLRFVDAAHQPAAPFVAGAVAAAVAAPVAWLLPLVSGGAALLLGVGVGLGVKSAQRDRNLLQ